MGMEHQQRFSAVQPRRFPSQSVSQYHSGNQPDISEVWQTQLEALLHKYEPGKEHHAHEMLRAYAGMERELIQCYRHHYTGKGGFCIPTQGSTDALANTSCSSGIFSLPKAAIGTYLQEKLRARRSQVSTNNSKGDDIRGPEMPSAAATPRRRRPTASSFDATTTRSLHINSSNNCAVAPLPTAAAMPRRASTAATSRRQEL